MLLLLGCLITAASAHGPHFEGLFNFSPTPQESKLTLRRGALPTWMKGTLMRVGPGMMEYGGRSVQYIPDGLCKVYTWEVIADGGVTFRANMLPTNLLNLTLSSGELAPYPLIGTLDPDFTTAELIKLAMRSDDYADNTNIAVWDLGTGSATLTTESPVMNSVHQTTGRFEGTFKSPGLDQLGMFEKPMFSASHFSRHPTSGSSYNYIFTMDLARVMLPWYKPQFHFYRYDADEAGKVSTILVGSLDGSLTDMRMLHAFGVTENYIVVPRWNINLGFRSASTVLTDLMHLCNGATFREDLPFYVDLISLETGHVTHFDLEPQRGVHIMNSYERVNAQGQREVVMDFPTSTNPMDPAITAHCMFDVLSVPILKNGSEAYNTQPWNTTLRRFIMNLDTQEASVVDLARSWEPLDLLVEFPYINPQFSGKPYCYCYLQGWQLRTMEMGLMKYDVCREEVVQWSEPGLHASEPVFVPGPGEAEDDGAIVAPVYNSNTGETLFYVWDAATMEVQAVYAGDAHVPFNIHGMWFNQ